jgi:maltose/moltooligosaccharide transporter
MFPIPFPLVLLVQLEIANLGFASFFSVCSIGSVWWSSYTTKEIPPTEEELKDKERAIGTLHHLLIYFRQLKTCQK